MQCSCGDVMLTREATDKKADLTLGYEACRSCGRVGAELLVRRSSEELLETGIEARRQYAEATGAA